MTTAGINELSKHIFEIHSGIEHLGLIDLEGHVALDKAATATVANEPDRERVLFYYQVSSRRNRREHFDDAYGKTTYIHIMREKMQQLMVYIPMFTVYLTINHAVNQDEIAIIAQSLHNIDHEIIDRAAKSLFYK
ncbi:MAG: hypothetical protein NZ747_06530 [Nitrosopumilus sp.]|nr:hypothetical protein [Nitrosopumilus sp.]